MYTTRLLIRWLLICSILAVPSFAQSAALEISHFSKDGLQFDYPADWSVTDESTDETQQLTLKRHNGPGEIRVVAKRGHTVRTELPSALESFREPLLKTAAAALGSSEQSLERNTVKSRVGVLDVEGVRLNVYGKSRWLADVIWLRTKLRLVGLVFIRKDPNDRVASKAWEIVRSTLTTDPPVLGTMEADATVSDQRSQRAGILNGRALELPQPVYPAIARAAHASGSVQVQVVIDEFGNVVAAHAIDGHPLLQAASVAAARQSRFSPTMLEGEPVRVAGVIVYNFIAK